MKLQCVAAGLLFAGSLSAADRPTTTTNHFTIVDEIVAKVNGDIVSRDELQRLAREAEQELKAQGDSGPKLDQDFQTAQKNLLRDRIDQLLLVQKGKELNINVNTEVAKYFADLQRRSKISDPEKFHEYIRQQSGMSYEDFQQETKNQMLTRNVIGQEVGRHINISPQEVQAYYNAHKNEFVREEKVYLSEILISTQGKDEKGVAAAEKKANLVASQAAKGERFSDLARDNSDANTAQQGGDLGVGYKKGDLDKALEDAVWNLPKGGVTKPIHIPNGFEILKVNDHTKAGLASLDDVRSEIENVLYGPKMQPKVRQYLTDLRQTAFLQIRPGYVDTGSAPGQDTKWQDPAQLKPETITKAEVQEKTKHKRLFGVVPIPGTQTTVTGKSSSR
jgi:peptidyl-prolyl cis-trans isomerase SurA